MPFHSSGLPVSVPVAARALLCLILGWSGALPARGRDAEQELPAVPERADAATIAETDPAFWAMTQARMEPLTVAAYQSGARRLLAQGTFAATRHAIRLLRDASQHHPDSAVVHALLSEALATPYRWTWKREELWIERSQAAFEKARELDPGEPEVLRAGALLAMLDHRLEESESLLRSARDADPGDVETLLLLGAVLRLEDRFRDAYPVYEQVLGVSPEDWRAYSGMADVYRDDEWFQEALVLYARAAGLEPGAFPPRFGAATVFQRMKYEGLAVLKYRDLLKEFPDSEGLILLAAASAHMGDRQYGAALSELEQISFGGRRGLCDGSVLYRIGICKLRLGDLDGAAEAFSRVIEDYPEARDGSDFGPLVLFGAAKQLSAVYEEQGFPEQAAQVMRRAAENDAAPIALLLDVAYKLSSYQLYDEAAETLRRGLERERPDDELYERLRLRVELARAVAGGAGPAESAAESRARLSELEDEVAEAGNSADCYQLARGHALAGDPQRAVEWLRRAVERGYRSFDLMRRDPDLAAVRDLPEYRELVRGR